MKNQYFRIAIIQGETGTSATGEFKCTGKFLTHYLARILKENPELIPLFLDATGQALIGSGHKLNSDQAQTLTYLEPKATDNRFFDEIFG